MIDLPGHGQSPPLREDDDLTSIAASVDATVASLGLRSPPRVVGHSLGGRVGLAWLRNKPHALSDLNLLDISPSPIPNGDSASGRVLEAIRRAPAEAPDRRALRTFLVDQGLSVATADWALMNVVCEASGCRWRIDREALARLHPRINQDDLWEVISGADVPVLCIRGGRSRYVSDADADRLVSSGCVVETLPDAGHDVHVDAPDAVIARLG
jgi:pimeloyl-ACP methyl ester carboxylesterase